MIYTSPTAQQWFHKCPANFGFRQTWKYIGPQEENLGSMVHRFLEEGTQVSPAMPDEAAILVEKLRRMEKMAHITVLKRELRQEWELVPGVWFVRILDVLGKVNNDLAVADYKTGKWDWSSLPEGRDKILCAPKSKTLQASGYMIPPPKSALKELELTEWPDTLYFLVATKKWTSAPVVSKVFLYNRNEEDEKHFLDSIELAQTAVEKRLLPKVREQHCNYCDYQPLCYHVQGYTKLYQKRKKKDFVEAPED